MAKFKDWTLHPNGDIELNPLTGWGMATLPEQGYALRLEYISAPDQPLEKPHSVQLAMSRPQLLELIEALQRMADAPHIPAPPTESRH